MAGYGYAEFYVGESVRFNHLLDRATDISTMTLVSYLRLDGATVDTYTPAANTPSLGSFRVSLPAADTADLDPGSYQLETWRTDAGAEAMLALVSVVVKAV